MSKVSVIVPVYNAEKYLNRCVDSLLNQTLQDIEIILIDDGSPDKSSVICDEYLKKDSRVKVIHKVNGGVSSARNEGLKIATGEFITFLDSDDYIEVQAYEVAYKTAKDNCCEYVMWGFFCDFIDENDNLINQRISVPKSTHYEPFQREELLNLSGYLWNKIYSKKMLDELKLSFKEDLTLYEDLLFNAQYIPKTRNSIFISEAFTHYIQRNVASLGKKYRENYFELANIALESHVKLLEFWKVEEERVKSHIVEQKYKTIWGAIRNVCLSNLSHNEKYKKIKQICKRKNYSKDILSAKNRSIKDIVRKIILLSRWSKLISKIIK